MLYTPNIVPGLGFMRFTVCDQHTEISDTGRPMNNKYVETDVSFYGILALTTPEERVKWKQDGHDVSHRIVQHTGLYKAKATDILLCEDGRCFYVTAEPRNPGNINATMIYYVEERNDMDEFIERVGD